jgi:hypothetical protein
MFDPHSSFGGCFEEVASFIGSDVVVSKWNRMFIIGKRPIQFLSTSLSCYLTLSSDIVWAFFNRFPIDSYRLLWSLSIVYENARVAMAPFARSPVDVNSRTCTAVLQLCTTRVRKG